MIKRWDWVEIYDGGDDTAPLIGGKLCGYEMPQAITSSGNQLFVKFHSDWSVVDSGYKIRADLGKSLIIYSDYTDMNMGYV